jgi:putative tryptophan/tyrosine transport system substrate-binding protein
MPPRGRPLHARSDLCCGAAPLRAAMAAAKTIPIIFSLAGDPVKQGIVSSLNRPGGNVTGVTFTTAPLGAKRLESVRELSSPTPRASAC